MPTIDRAAVRPPTLPKESVHVAAIGGDVVVRGLLLSERLELAAMAAELKKPQPGESESMASSRAGSRLVAQTLARVVVLADDAPLWSVAEWEQFGSVNPDDVLNLYKAARRLSGQDPEVAEKN